MPVFSVVFWFDVIATILHKKTSRLMRTYSAVGYKIGYYNKFDDPLYTLLHEYF